MKAACLALCLVVCGVAQANAQIRVPEIPAAPPVVMVPPPPPPPPSVTLQPLPHVPVCTMQCAPSGFCQAGQICPQDCRQVCN